MPNTIINDIEAVEQGISRTYENRQGWTTERSFRGTQSFIEAKDAELRALGYSTRVKQGPVWELIGTVSAYDDGSGPDDENSVVDTWEMSANPIEKDILQSNNALVDALPQTDRNILRDFANGTNKFEDYDLTTAKKTPKFTAGPTYDIALTLYKLLASGLKSIVVYQPVLRHTKTVSQSYEIPASLANVGWIYSTSALISAESPTPDIAANLPASGYTRGGGTPLATYGGWLKNYPQIVDAAFSKVQIVQEWHWGEWPEVLYDLIT